MGNGQSDLRRRFEEATFPHLQALWTTGLWLTKRASRGDQLIARTATQAYLSWKPEHLTATSDSGSGDQQRPANSVDRRELVLFTGISPMAVKGAVARLRPPSRLIMILHFRERFSYNETAYITDLRVGSVKVILNRVRRLIPQYVLHYANKVMAESNRDAIALELRATTECSS